jgi:Glycosyl hydrolase family 26.
MYSYSTDVFDTKDAYLDRYPGDAFIDVLGYDDYHSVVTTATQETFVNRLHMLIEMAEERGKIAALTETGVEIIPDPTWWTQTLRPALDYDDMTRKIAWVMVWRNAVDRANHYYAPYPGHPSVPDFRAFRDHPLIYFEEELPDLYR